MRTKEEIDNRIIKVSGFIELSKEMGQSNQNLINKLKKELRVLAWVINEDETNTKTMIPNTMPHVQDRIIVLLRDEKEPIPLSEILYNTGESSGAVGAALRSLVLADRINRFGESKKYTYSIKSSDAVEKNDERGVQ